MLKKYTCIVCPNGCCIEVETVDNKIVSISGATCKQGREYVEHELTDPRRNIASSVLVDGGVLPLVSVRTSKPIPKEKIFEVMAKIKEVRLQAPIKVGQVIIPNVLGFGSNIIATKSVNAKL